MSNWGGLVQLEGQAAAALLGLLFVGVSIRVDVIATSVELRNRAFQTVVLFLTALLATLLVDIPERERWIGVEFLVLAGVTLAAILVVDRRAQRAPRVGSAAVEHIAHVIDVINPIRQTVGLLAAAGVALLLAQGWGLYVFAAAVILVLVDGVFNAWFLLVRVAT